MNQAVVEEGAYMKITTCKKCSYKNNATVKYCQRCGQPLKEKFSLRGALEGSGGVSIAGMGSKNISLGPLGVEAARNDAREIGNTQTAEYRTIVDPLPDGTWFCPDCGFHNSDKTKTCKSCKRQF